MGFGELGAQSIDTFSHCFISWDWHRLVVMPAWPLGVILMIPSPRFIFAALAMQGAMAADSDNIATAGIIATWAVEAADTLIAELNKPNKKSIPDVTA